MHKVIFITWILLIVLIGLLIGFHNEIARYLKRYKWAAVVMMEVKLMREKRKTRKQIKNSYSKEYAIYKMIRLHNITREKAEKLYKKVGG